MTHPNTCPECCTTQKGEEICTQCKEEIEIEVAFEEATFELLKMFKAQLSDGERK